MIAIDGAVGQTQVVIAIIFGLIVLSSRRTQSKEFFSLSVTQELKGLSILLIFFSHVGNFLIADHRFLAPLTGLSGASVDVFFLLSGYGLSVSNLRRPQKVSVFYRRLLKLFVPFWIVLSGLLAADFLVFGQHYSLHFLRLAFAGIFLRSDLSHSLNAPFWFITAIAFYYLVFPLVFSKKHLWLSALAIFGMGVAVVVSNPPALDQVMFLYRLHYAAFPLGMLLAWACNDPRSLVRLQFFKVQQSLLYQVAQRSIRSVTRRWLLVLRLLAIGGLILVLFRLNPHAHISQAPAVQQVFNLLFALALLLLFIVKQVDFRILRLLGVYSFEFYLIHWPLISRYGLLYNRTPAWLATLFYLAIITILGYGLQQCNIRLWALKKTSLPIAKLPLS